MLPRLTALSLRGCQLSAGTLARVLAAARQLRRLDVAGCTGLHALHDPGKARPSP